VSGCRRRWAAAGLGALLLLAAACGDDGSPEGSGERAAAPDAVVTDGAYEWRAVPIGGGGFVTGLVALPAGPDEDGTRVYARTDVGGAYRWDEATRAWTQLLRAGAGSVALEEGDYSVASIAAAPSDPDTVVLAVGADFDPGEGESLSRTGRVLVSRDGGVTWAASPRRWFVNGNQRFRTATERLAIDPSDPDRWWFGTQREGLWTTGDGGTTWEQVPLDQVPAGLTADPADQQAGVSLVAVVGATVVAGVANAGVYATDDGSTWRQVVALGQGHVPRSATPAGDDLLFTVGITGSGSGEPRILRLPGGGGSVTDLALPAASWTWNVAADPFDPDHLVATDEAVRDGALWTSDDGGAAWRSHDVDLDTAAIGWLGATDLESYMSAGRLVFDPAVRGRVWFAEGMGVWRTDDLDVGTVTWEVVARGIEETVVSSILVPEGGLPVVTVADRQGFLVEDLDRYPAAPLVDERFASGTSVAASAADPSRLAWVGAESNVTDVADAEPRGAVSSDGGRTWDEMGGLERAMFGGEVAVSATDPDVLVWLPTHFRQPFEFLTDPVGLYASSDGGRSWEHVEPDGDVDSFHRYFWWFGRRALAADSVDSSFYLLSDEERFYRSTDGGSTWERARHAPPCSEPLGCHVEGQLHAVPGRAGALWASTGDGGLYRTDDAGATPWERVEGIDEAGPFGFGAPAGDSDEPAVYVHGRAAGEGGDGLWRSIDGGRSWTLVSRAPGGLAATVNAVAGDPAQPGRVYVGFAGVGAVVGDDRTL
jgi:hypothetical protein